MKKAIAFAFLAVACAATADVAPLFAPRAVAAGKAVTNSVAAPVGMTGWATVLVQQSVAVTNKPPVYQLLTCQGTNDTVTAALSEAFAPPQTNAAPVVSFTFPSAAVNRRLALVTRTQSGGAVTNAAALVFTPTYPERR